MNNSIMKIIRKNGFYTINKDQGFVLGKKLKYLFFEFDVLYTEVDLPRMIDSFISNTTNLIYRDENFIDNVMAKYKKETYWDKGLTPSMVDCAELEEELYAEARKVVRSLRNLKKDLEMEVK